MFGVLSNAQRIVLNTSAQYVKTIVNTFLSFYSTRLILRILGVEDFGIYSLLAGVVALLAFITNALISTTQRYLNFYQGKHDEEGVRTAFNNSVVLHLLLGLFFLIFVETIGLFIFDGFLKIPEQRIGAGKFVYHCVALILMVTFIAAPFRALNVSHENIVYISLIDIIDGFLKLIIALMLPYWSYDKLKIYGLCMLALPVVNLIAFYVYDIFHYNECKKLELRDFSLNYMRALLAYAGWTIYSTGCIIVRTQGLAILLNRYIGAVANAAYGIAMQVAGAVRFIASSFVNAVNPQLMKAEGAGDRKKMLIYAEIESKYAFLLLAMLVVPCVFEMPYLLNLWLGKVPEFAVLMCRMILIASLVDQITIGLGSANQAIGKIRNYSIAVNSVKLLTLPAAYFCLRLHCSIDIVMLMYVLFEFLCAIIRLPFVAKTAGISVVGFWDRVVLRVLLPMIVLTLSCYCFFCCFNPGLYRVLGTFLISNMIYLCVVYMLSLTKMERDILMKVVKR